MRVASLFDGTAWALVTPEHLYALSTAQPMGNTEYHAALLDTYRGSATTFAAVPDDGYIMQVSSKGLALALGCVNSEVQSCTRRTARAVGDSAWAACMRGSDEKDMQHLRALDPALMTDAAL